MSSEVNQSRRKALKYGITAVIAAAAAGVGGYAAWQTVMTPTKTVAISFTYQPSDHHLAAFIMLEKGWIQEDAKKLGYNVTIVEQAFPSGPPQMERFMAGAIDVAYVGSAPPISEVAQAIVKEKEGKDIPKAIIVAAANQQGSGLVLSNELAASYNGPESLKGKTIGTYPPGSIQDTILKEWLIKNGLNAGVDIKIQPGAPEELVDLLTAGKVDGIFVPSPAPEIAEAKGLGKIMITSKEIAPSHSCCVLVLNNKFIEKYPDLAQLIVEEHIRASKFIKENPDEALSIGADKLTKLWGYDREFVDTVMRNALVNNPTGLNLDPDPHKITDSVMTYAEIQYSLGYIPLKPAVGDLFNFSLYDKAVKTLE